jgi:hypothetical protein
MNGHKPSMKPGDLVHFVDSKSTQYDTLGMILGYMPPRTSKVQRPGMLITGLLKVVWYDDPSCGVEDYNEEDLELVSEGWRFS